MTFTKAMTNTVTGSMQTMVMQTKLQYFRIVVTSASPPTSLQHSGWKANSALEHGMQQGSLILDGRRTHYSIDFVRYAGKDAHVISRKYHTYHAVPVGLFATL